MRTQFTFYRSFFESMEDLKELEDTETELAIYRAIAEYSLNGTEPILKGYAKAIWRNIVPTLDRANKKSDTTKEANKISCKLPSKKSIFELTDDELDRLKKGIESKEDKHISFDDYIASLKAVNHHSQNFLSTYGKWVTKTVKTPTEPIKPKKELTPEIIEKINGKLLTIDDTKVGYLNNVLCMLDENNQPKKITDEYDIDMTKEFILEHIDSLIK